MTTVIKRERKSDKSYLFAESDGFSMDGERFLKSDTRRRWSAEAIQCKLSDFTYLEQMIAYRKGWRKESLGTCDECEDGSDHTVHSGYYVWLCRKYNSTQNICAFCWDIASKAIPEKLKPLRGPKPSYVENLLKILH